VKVVQVFRKPHPALLSIEKVFAVLAPELSKVISLDRIELPRYTSGLSALLQNLRWLRRNRTDAVYHVTGDVHYAVLALPRRRTLLTVHDLRFLEQGGPKARILKWLFLDLPVRRASRITAISEFSRNEIVRLTACDPGKISVVPNPLSGEIRYSERSFRQERPVLLFIGTTPNKNLERAVEALQDIPCHFRLLGKPTAEQLARLDASGLPYDTLSDLSEAALSDAYADADIVFYPSLYEGFGLPIIEGQAAGRVIVTSDLEPMRTVAGGGAILCDPTEVASIRKAVLTAIHDTDARETALRNGKANIKHYSPEVIADRYAALYAELAR